MVEAYEALNLDNKRAIDMETRLSLKINERVEVAVKPGSRGFVPKVKMEECIIDFLKSYHGGKK